MTDSIAGLDPCVHCGFCLQACPTYVATGDESDSPRGRIVLMQAAARGDLPISDKKLAYHLDRCLGCRACESACPSGVEYGLALEHTREALAKAHGVPWMARLVLAVMAEPRLRRPVLRASRLLRPIARRLAGRSRLGFSFGMLAATKMKLDGKRGGGEDEQATEGRKDGKTEGAARDVPPYRRAAVPPGEGGRAVVFRGCIMDDLFSHVHDATARTLRVNGLTLVSVPQQGCCGALHAHAGLLDGARELARQNVLAFRQHANALLVVNAAGCGAMLKGYGTLLRGTPLEAEATALAAKVRDVTEVLAERGPRTGAALRMTVAVDPPCHLQHAQRVVDQPLKVLQAIPGLEVCTPAHAEQCCGSAGVYSVVEPGLSQQVLSHKLASLAATGADAVATGNPGCVMQIGAGMLASRKTLPVVHPVEFLDLSYEQAGYYGNGSDP